MARDTTTNYIFINCLREKILHRLDFFLLKDPQPESNPLKHFSLANRKYF